MRRLSSTDELMNEMEKALLKRGLVKKGDIIVITGSLPPAYIEGKTNFMKIQRIK